MRRHALLAFFPLLGAMAACSALFGDFQEAVPVSAEGGDDAAPDAPGGRDSALDGAREAGDASVDADATADAAADSTTDTSLDAATADSTLDTGADATVDAGMDGEGDATGLRSATSITLGFHHACVIVDGGTVECWGDNDEGQLGNGDAGTSSATPVAVSVPGITAPTALAAGGNHTCALLPGGTVECWGEGDHGELGNGSFDAGPEGVIAGLQNVFLVAAGDSHSCAALTDGGGVECWGEGAQGQLGNGSDAGSSTPVSVIGLGPVMGLVAGGTHTCALVAEAGVECWGAIGDTPIGDVPVHIVGFSGTVMSLVAGSFHTCALLAGGTVNCWGSNSNGQLGNDMIALTSETPVRVSGLTGVLELAAGHLHTCALLGDGGVECWGDNKYSELGNGTSGGAGPAPPGPVSGLIGGVTAIAAGGNDTCALALGTGTVECWGYDVDGELGNGTEGDAGSAIPVLVQ